MNAYVAGLSVKPETAAQSGLPKRAVEQLAVTLAGAAGDFNRYRTRTLHGDPDSAILVLSEAILEGLRAEGWAVEPGHLGENILLGGLPDGALAPGSQLGIGTLLLEVTRACDPCTELYELPYVGPARGPAFLRTLHQRRGWYARVLAAGAIARGDPVHVTSPRETP